MVEQTSARLDALFHALADPTRREILRRLTEGERSVSELAAPFLMSLPAVCKHVAVLEAAGLVSRSLEGRRQMCALNPAGFAPADVWIDGSTSLRSRKV
jgi:DNA-binding transcriptional ArsR family regulator